MMDTSDTPQDDPLGFGLTVPPTNWAPSAKPPEAAGTPILGTSGSSSSALVSNNSPVAPATSPSPAHTLLNYARNPAPPAGSGT